jgi:hypothetical protein
VKFAYLDQPYLGCCSYYGHNHNDGGSRPFDGGCWNNITTHRRLIDWATDNYDGFAMCMGSNNIIEMSAPLQHHNVHWGAWVKPFASFKPGINPGYCWEPVAFYGGRALGRNVDTVRDFCSESITLKKGLAGAKPFKFCLWVLDMLGFRAVEDSLDDIFPGTGIMQKAVAFKHGVPAEQMGLVLQ